MSIPSGAAQNVGKHYVWGLELRVWKVEGRIAAFNYE